jgi:CMP-N-acetylneuraminic acid synthetase
VRAGLATYARGGADIVIGVTPAASNPYFNMLKLDAQGHASLACQPEGTVFRRQDAPEIFDIAPGAYITSPDFVLSNSGIFDGVLKTFIIPQERAVDIDTMLDFEFAEFLLCKGQAHPSP